MPPPNQLTYETREIRGLSITHVASVTAAILQSVGISPAKVRHNDHSPSDTNEMGNDIVDGPTTWMVEDAEGNPSMTLAPHEVTWTRVARRKIAIENTKRASATAQRTNHETMEGSQAEPSLAVFRAKISIKKVDAPAANEGNKPGRDRAREASPTRKGKEKAQSSTELKEKRYYIVQLDWIEGEGKHRATLEGFWSFLIRKIGDELKREL